MSPKHLADVRAIGICLCCGRIANSNPWEPMVAHHLLRSGEHAMGRKSSDRWAVPMLNGCHAYLHSVGDEDAFFSERFIDARAVATALWSERGNEAALRRIIDRARQQAYMKGQP